jgi:hypothetical protein
MKYFEKVAVESEDVLYGAVASAPVAYKQYKDGNITGRETLYHQTDTDAAKNIKKRGVRSIFASKPDNVTNTLLKDVSMSEKKNKTYFHKSKFVNVQDVNGKPKTVIKAKIPVWKKNLTSNPELLGAKNFPEFRKKIKEKYWLFGPSKTETRLMYRELGPKTRVFKGGISPRYIKGSKHYRPETLKEIGSFIKNNPKKFAKGIGFPLLAAGVVAGGSSLLEKKSGVLNILKGSDDVAKALLAQKVRDKGSDKAYRVARKMLEYSAKKKYPNKIPLPKMI